VHPEAQPMHAHREAYSRSKIGLARWGPEERRKEASVAASWDRRVYAERAGGHRRARWRERGVPWGMESSEMDVKRCCGAAGRPCTHVSWLRSEVVEKSWVDGTALCCRR
jgi:hypothetical protein